MEKNLPADSGVDIRNEKEESEEDEQFDSDEPVLAPALHTSHWCRDQGASFGPHQGAGGSDVLGDQAAGTVHQRGEHAVEKPCYCHRHSWEADR